MDSGHLHWLLGKFGAVRSGSYYLAYCPICQSDEQEWGKQKLNLAPGSSCPILLFCHRGCTEKYNKAKNSAYVTQACRAVGVDPALLNVKMDAGKIRLIWSQLGVTALEDRPLPAPPETLHLVYSDLINELELTEPHRRWLCKRGLDSDWAFGAGYRSTPPDPKELCKKLWEKWGFRLSCIPGFSSVFSSDSIRLLTRFPAVLTPCRNEQGQILALKQRLLDGGAARLRLLGNSRDGGPKAVTLAHIPLGVGCHKWDELWLTEGERKADVYWTQKGKATIAIPGTGNWKLSASAIDSLLVPSGVLVVGMDLDGKPQTLNAEKELVRMGIEKGFKVKVARWEGVKGLDDALVKGVEIKVEEAPEQLVNSSLTFCIQAAMVTLKDWEICKYIKDNGPVLRADIPLRNSGQEHLISKWIREGLIEIVEKGSRGQLLRAVQ